MHPAASSLPSRRFAVAALFAAVLTVPLPSRAAENALDIAAASALPLGSVVTVAGSVTIPSGDFSSSTFDAGFTLQDRTGGIYVSVAVDLGLAPREQVRVTGQLADNGHGVLNLIPARLDDVKVEGKGPKVEPRPVATADVNEATESVLLAVEGTIVGPIVPDPPYGTILMLDDGSGPIRIFVCTSTGIDLGSLAPGDRLSVTGVGYQFGDYEVDPRFQSDVRRLGD